MSSVFLFSSTFGSECPSCLSSEGPGARLVRVTCPHRSVGVTCWTRGMRRNTMLPPGRRRHSSAAGTCGEQGALRSEHLAYLPSASLPGHLPGICSLPADICGLSCAFLRVPPTLTYLDTLYTIHHCFWLCHGYPQCQRCVPHPPH